MIKPIVKTVKSLFGNTRPSELGLGVAFGVLLGLMPAGNLTWISILILTLFFRVNTAIQLLTLLGVGLLSVFFTGPLEALGAWILVEFGVLSALPGLFTLPILPFFAWNNTLLMGGAAVGLVLFVPVMVLSMLLIKVLREKVMPGLAESPLVKGIANIPLVKTFMRVWNAADGIGE